MRNKLYVGALFVVCLVVVVNAIGVPGPLPPMSELFPPPESPIQRCNRGCNKGCAYPFTFCEWWCGVACEYPPSFWISLSDDGASSKEKFPVPTDKDYEDYVRLSKGVSSSSPSPPTSNDGSPPTSNDGSL